MSATETLRLGTKERRLDESAIQQGRECTPPPYLNLPGVTAWVLPAATYNPRCRRATRKYAPQAAAELAEKVAAGEIDDDDTDAFNDLLEDLVRKPEFVVDALIADIDGLYNGNDNPVKYTRERGLQILSDPGYADVLDWIVTEAQRLGKFYESSLEEDEGN